MSYSAEDLIESLSQFPADSRVIVQGSGCMVESITFIPSNPVENEQEDTVYLITNRGD